MSQQRIELLFDHLTIQRKVRSLGLRLQTDGLTEGLVMLSLVGGSVMFLADLARAIPGDVRYDFVKVGYSPSGADGSILDVSFPISTDVRDQNVLILKDVVSTGVTEIYLTEQLTQGGVGSLKFATLIDLPGERKTDFEADYRLFTSERKGTFVGYGLKQGGLFGNLPYVGILPSE